MNTEPNFEWDENKDKANQEKHRVSFSNAQLAFLDRKRVILKTQSIALMKSGITALVKWVEVS